MLVTLQGVTLPLHNDSWDKLQHMCFTCQNTLIGPLGVLFQEMGEYISGLQFP